MQNGTSALAVASEQDVGTPALGLPNPSGPLQVPAQPGLCGDRRASRLPDATGIVTVVPVELTTSPVVQDQWSPCTEQVVAVPALRLGATTHVLRAVRADDLAVGHRVPLGLGQVGSHAVMMPDEANENGT